VPHAPAAALAVLLLALAAGCDSSEEGNTGQASRQPAGPREPTGEQGAAIDRPALREHLRALQRIATDAGGNRAAGTPGDRASADYVGTRLRDAGWRVTRQSFGFPYFRERSSSLSVGGRRLRRGPDYGVLGYSGSGRASGPARRFGRGCAPTAFADLPRGGIAVADRGDCFFRVKAEHAESAGAAALLIANDPEEVGVPSATLGGVGVRIPVLIVNGDVPLGEGTRVALEVNAESERRRTQNVIAETPGGAAGRVVMAGAHLDSVPSGPNRPCGPRAGAGPRRPSSPSRRARRGPRSAGDRTRGGKAGRPRRDKRSARLRHRRPRLLVPRVPVADQHQVRVQVLDALQRGERLRVRDVERVRHQLRPA
jgi:PA domain